MFAIDFETARWVPGLQAPPPVCMSVASESTFRGRESTLFKDWSEGLRTILESDAQIVGCNIAYDFAVACEDDPKFFKLVFDAYDADRITDVAIRQKLIDIALGEYRQHGKYSVQSLASRLLDVRVEKEDTWRLRYWDLINVPLEAWPQDAIDYSRIDSEITRDIYFSQEKELVELDKTCVLDDQYRQARAEFALKLASAWGLRTNREGVERLRVECEATRDRLETELLTKGLLRRTVKKGVPGISKCVRVAQARMAEKCPDARQTKKGIKLKSREVKYISVDKEACKDSGDPLLENYSEYSQIGTFLVGAWKTIAGGVEMPIHTNFEVLLETGRTSSSDPPVQNLSRKPGVRECFEPRPGYCYIGCDYDKAELHTLAQVCINLFGRSVLGDALNNGYDPHIGLGARLARTTYDDLKAQIKAKVPGAKGWRSRSKPGNFGYPGGMGPSGMKRYAKSNYGVVLTLEESQALKDGWAEQWPVVAIDYLGWIRNLTQATGSATIEHFGSGRWRGNVPYCTAANSFFQGMSADGMKAGLWEVCKRCYLPGYALSECRVVNEIHDELLVEAPLGIASDAAWEMKKVMIDAYNQYTPDVPVNATPALMDRWSKGAETIMDDNGNFQVWRYEA